MSYPTKDEAVSRYVAACKQFDKENASSAFNLNSVVKLWDRAQQEEFWSVSDRNDEILSKYVNIPESVIKSIKGLLEHNREVSDILFSGCDESHDLDKYIGEKKAFFSELRDIARGK
jgi:WD40 repeat protein